MMTKIFIFTVASVFIITLNLEGAKNNKQCTAAVVSSKSINELNQDGNKKVKDFADTDNNFENTDDEETMVIRARRSAKPDPRRGSTSRLGRTTYYNSGSSSGGSSGGGGDFSVIYIILGSIFGLAFICLIVYFLCI